jgi:hypothetical protein
LKRTWNKKFSFLKDIATFRSDPPFVVRPSWHIAHDKRASRHCLLSLSSAEAAKLEIVLRFLRFIAETRRAGELPQLNARCRQLACSGRRAGQFACRTICDESGRHFAIWGALLSLMASRDQVGRVWDNWLSERLRRHSKTDSRIELGIVRLAADGVWLERIMNAKSKNIKGVEEYLIEMTRIR